MLIFDENDKKFEVMPSTLMKTENILERYGLQQAITTSWNIFRTEIGYPEAYLIGDEVTPDESTQNSIDLIAYNPTDGAILVIELKRDKNKLQLLQALSYAAMVDSWDVEILISKINRSYSDDPDELIESIKANGVSTDVKIILIAEKFDPEVIITANWLTEKYNLDITAFALHLYSMKEGLALTVEQRYPLKDLKDSYESRKIKKKVTDSDITVSWDDVIKKVNYPFAEECINMCKLKTAGDPSRRRFLHVRTNLDGFSWITLNLRNTYLNVYLKGVFDGNIDILKSKFTDSIEVNEWRDGLSFNVHQQKTFNELKEWLLIS